MDKPLNNQIAIISGGAGDIGRAIAAELSRRGAKIAIGDLRENEGTKVDVSDPDAVRAWVEDVERTLGLPTLIVPNAAIVTMKSSLAVSPAEWRKEMSINLDGAFHLAQAAAQRLIANKKPGRIVFIGSWAAHAPHPNITTYCVAKAGLRMLCKCMALELAQHGILVNEVAPGYVNAGLSAQVWEKNPGAREQARLRVPLQKLIDAHDVALQVAHLCDPENRHMTGSTLLMDGGLSLVTPANK